MRLKRKGSREKDSIVTLSDLTARRESLYCIRNICIHLVAYKMSFYAGKARYPRLINPYGFVRTHFARERVRELQACAFHSGVNLCKSRVCGLLSSRKNRRPDPRCRFVHRGSRDHVSACDPSLSPFQIFPPPPLRRPTLIAEMG